MSSCSWLPSLGGWWQDLHSGNLKTLHSVKHTVVCVGGDAEVSSTRRRSPGVNLRRSRRVGAWNALSRRDGDGPGICLGDVQTFLGGLYGRVAPAPGVPTESGRNDALWRMLPMYVQYVYVFFG